jgi:DNA/RNA endonuclease G (NUC1)
MKKILTILLLTLCTIISYSQKVDEVIDKKIYKSYFCNEYKVPLYVTYKLYHCPVNSECDRKNMHFKNDLNIPAATPADYKGSKYDEGHMADAGDFSVKGHCDVEETTFRFYNALPQTHNLNAGIWKSLESTVRKESETDSLFVICGGIFTDTKTLNNTPNGVRIPTKCWKVVKDLQTGKYTHISVFTNDQQNSLEMKLQSIAELENLLGYKLIINL